MSKLSKKAILSVLTLVLTVVALGATTFAWFTLGTTATVDQFNVEVRGSEGLEISLDGDNWYTRLNSTTMNNHINNVFTNGRLDAVTLKDATANFDQWEFEKFDGMTGSTVNLTGATKNNEYLEFNLQFRTKNDDQKVQLTAMTLTSTGLPWTPDVPYKFENGDDVSSTTTGLQVFPHYGARVSLNDKIFQADLESNNLGFDLNKGAHNYLAVKNGLTEIDGPSPLPTYVDGATGVNSVTTTTPIVVLGSFISGTDYNTGVVTVRVWLEGWDANTYDAIFDGTLQIGFTFELVPVTTP